MIKNMVLVYILGQMEEDTKDSGHMVNNMVKENIYYQMDK